MTVMDRLKEHYEEAKLHFPEDRIVGIFLQGSQNYGLDTEFSDVDTKLVVVPTFEQLAMNAPSPVSTTHIRANDEHIDFKDVRLMLQLFKKQNMNFLEILFTKYKIINPLYADAWEQLVSRREEIARYNVVTNVKAMKGVAMEKYHAMEHRYPAKIEVIDLYGYDPKQLHHLLRVEEYIERYLAGEDYETCMFPENADYLKKVKLGLYNLEQARYIGKNAIDHITRMVDTAVAAMPNEVNSWRVDTLINTVQFDIMRIAVEEELRNV